MHVAADAATLNLLAPGRVVLGIGAGHTPREWADIGRERPSPPERAGRLAEFAEAVAGLLAGQSVTLDGQYLAVRDARLDGVLACLAPAGTAPVRLVIGGGHPRLLRAAARLADVVGLAGLGRTLPDGHQHEVRWSAADLRGQLDLIRAEASRAGRGAPGLEALVQVVTGHRRPRRGPGRGRRRDPQRVRRGPGSHAVPAHRQPRAAGRPAPQAGAGAGHDQLRGARARRPGPAARAGPAPRLSDLARPTRLAEVAARRSAVRLVARSSGRGCPVGNARAYPTGHPRPGSGSAGPAGRPRAPRQYRSPR